MTCFISSHLPGTTPATPVRIGHRRITLARSLVPLVFPRKILLPRRTTPIPRIRARRMVRKQMIFHTPAPPECGPDNGRYAIHFRRFFPFTKTHIVADLKTGGLETADGISFASLAVAGIAALDWTIDRSRNGVFNDLEQDSNTNSYPQLNGKTNYGYVNARCGVKHIARANCN